jgi:hypothetical protein
VNYLRSLSLPVIVFWLLLPPGICVCKLTTFYASVFSSISAASMPLTELADDDDHAGWCPVHKIVYLWTAAAILSVILLLVIVDLWRLTPFLTPFRCATRVFRSPLPADIPRHHSLLNLLI